MVEALFEIRIDLLLLAKYDVETHLNSVMGCPKHPQSGEKYLTCRILDSCLYRLQSCDIVRPLEVKNCQLMHLISNDCLVAILIARYLLEESDQTVDEEGLLSCKYSVEVLLNRGHKIRALTSIRYHYYKGTAVAQSVEDLKDHLHVDCL